MAYVPYQPTEEEVQRGKEVFRERMLEAQCKPKSLVYDKPMKIGRQPGDPALFEESLHGSFDYSKSELVEATEKLQFSPQRTAEQYRTELMDLATSQDFPAFRQLVNLRIAGLTDEGMDTELKAIGIRKVRTAMKDLRGEDADSQAVLKQIVDWLCDPK